ncbi:unnamed protein product [Mytilus coruscus]|uniref:Uncharacterized protein n=1 Tax=Mytilus coruscus TaxID=42192 RepID=A0A6J8CAN5_MYTCO|nr:unnamed protein product [Mytilus coruscus]
MKHREFWEWIFKEEFYASLMVSKSHMMISGHKIRLYKLGFTTCANVKLSENVVIPPESELTVKGHVFGQRIKTQSVLEPRKDLNKQGLMIARTLCQESDNTIFVNAINLTNKPVNLKKDTLLGKLDPVINVQPLTLPENFQDTSETVNVPDHLKCLIDKASPELTKNQKFQLEKLIVEYQDIFTSPDGKLGRTGIVKHSIDTGDAKPIRVPPRRVPLTQRKTIETEIDKMLENDVIEPSSSAWRPHKKCKREDCPDCTNEDLVSAKNSENCQLETDSLPLAPIRVIKSDQEMTQKTCMIQDNLTSEVANDDLENSLIPNWLLVWTDEQISVGKIMILTLRKFFI